MGLFGGSGGIREVFKINPRNGGNTPIGPAGRGGGETGIGRPAQDEAVPQVGESALPR